MGGKYTSLRWRGIWEGPKAQRKARTGRKERPRGCSGHFRPKLLKVQIKVFGEVRLGERSEVTWALTVI